MTTLEAVFDFSIILYVGLISNMVAFDEFLLTGDTEVEKSIKLLRVAGNTGSRNFAKLDVDVACKHVCVPKGPTHN